VRRRTGDFGRKLRHVNVRLRETKQKDEAHLSLSMQHRPHTISSARAKYGLTSSNRAPAHLTSLSCTSRRASSGDSTPLEAVPRESPDRALAILGTVGATVSRFAVGASISWSGVVAKVSVYPSTATIARTSSSGRSISLSLQLLDATGRSSSIVVSRGDIGSLPDARSASVGEVVWIRRSGCAEIEWTEGKVG